MYLIVLRLNMNCCLVVYKWFYYGGKKKRNMKNNKNRILKIRFSANPDFPITRKCTSVVIT